MLITIGHTYGSGGLEIGRRLAAGWRSPAATRSPTKGRPLTGGTRLLRGGGPVRRPCSVRQPGLNRIFIHCGMEQRVERLMRERGPVPAEAARRRCARIGNGPRLYGLHTGAKWGEVGRYDLTVTAVPWGYPGTVELLSQFIALKTMRRRSKEAAHAGTTD